MIDRKLAIGSILTLCIIFSICLLSAGFIGIGKDSEYLYESAPLFFINLILFGLILLFSGFIGGVLGIIIVFGLFPRKGQTSVNQYVIRILFVVMLSVIFPLISYLILDPEII
jgi:hypothetical protein